MTTICGADAVSKIFSLFHDGVIAAHAMDQGNLELVVDISYLAQRLHPGYRSFRVSLFGVQDLRFTTWPKETAALPATLHALPDIFELELDILSGESEGNLVKVICNQPAALSSHCGGELYFSAAGAIVTDEAGKTYSLDQLHELAQAYWDEWSSRKGK